MNGKQKRALRAEKRAEKGLIDVHEKLILTSEIKAVLRSIAEEIGEGFCFDAPYDFGNVLSGRLRSESFLGYYILNYAQDRLLFCIDHKDCFNKDSQCPINVILPVGKREFKRLVDACKFLMLNDGIEASNTFSFGSRFEEFGSYTRDKFYNEL